MWSPYPHLFVGGYFRGFEIASYAAPWPFWHRGDFAGVEGISRVFCASVLVIHFGLDRALAVVAKSSIDCLHGQLTQLILSIDSHSATIVVIYQFEAPMHKLLEVPLTEVISLTAERAVALIRDLLRSECGYAKISSTALTISSRLTTSDGGIDAEINVPTEVLIPSDCLFSAGLTGFQLKSGTSFKPWTESSIRKELLDKKGQLYPEVKRLVSKRGRYVVICTGHDLTPEQRNDARDQIAKVLKKAGVEAYGGLVEVLGASQIADFAERYPGIANQLSVDPIQEAWVLDEWQQDAHMINTFEASSEQGDVISKIREDLKGEAKHIRLLGEPGLGKTRIVLEAVKEDSLRSYVLYFQYGTRFSQTKLFRQLIRFGYDKPLILIIDELPEAEMSEIWRHLKPRCGALKIISIDHGHDDTFDKEITRILAPRLSDEVIKKILISHVGEEAGIERWVNICEGSPRVAQAVAENLSANPEDLLKPPSTIPIWARFLHGYGERDAARARQVDCVAQHLSLFSRFGYEEPVGDEAIYIAEVIKKVDPTIGWAQFQEIVQNLRARRVLQGSRTLFFVPKALHIYLWRQFWEQYGRGFNFAQYLSEMPSSLQLWFMNMFKFSDGKSATSVINNILMPNGFFSNYEVLTSEKESRFLSILSEANPAAVLRLLEATVGSWTNEQLFNFKGTRQNVVWALEKIAVWPELTVRAMEVLVRLAINENADYSNNATGVVVGLFRIGPEAAATEASPKVRLPAMLRLLRSPTDAERRLALKGMAAALQTYHGAFRIVGPEYQGLRERAKLWIPVTYGELWEAQREYFQALIDETKKWPSGLRSEVCLSLLNAVEHQILTPPCTELAFHVLGGLINDNAMEAEKLNSFFWNWREYKDASEYRDISLRLRRIERFYTRRNLISRFRRYVVDVDYLEWDADFRQEAKKKRTRAQTLVDTLAERIAEYPKQIRQLADLLAPTKFVPALRYFGTQLARRDENFALLPELIEITLANMHDICLSGYMSVLNSEGKDLYVSTVKNLLDDESRAWLGVSLALEADYNDELFSKCLGALEKGWVEPRYFSYLRGGRKIEDVPPLRIRKLLNKLSRYQTDQAKILLIEFLDDVSFDNCASFNPNFVFRQVKRLIPNKENDVMASYHWKRVGLKLIKWSPDHSLPLFDALLQGMKKNYRLSYDGDVLAVANQIVRLDPVGAWDVIKMHFEKALPKWRSDIFTWLKGGLVKFDENGLGGAINDLPKQDILEWIDENPEARAPLVAHAVPATLDDDGNGSLTRDLLGKYGNLSGVRSGISMTFHTGGWTGPTSLHLKRKREKCRRWLASSFGPEIDQWIEREIQYLDREIDREEINEERDRFD